MTEEADRCGQGDSGGFHAENTRAERNFLPTGSESGIDLSVGKAAFGANGELSWLTLGQIEFAKLGASGMGKEATYRWGLAVARPQPPGCNPCGPRLWLTDLHETVAPALFGRFDHGPVQAFNRVVVRLSYGALGIQRHERRNAQRGELFDQPFLAIAFRQRDSDCERERQFAVDFLAFDDSQIGLGSAQMLRQSL